MLLGERVRDRARGDEAEIDDTFLSGVPLRLYSASASSSWSSVRKPLLTVTGPVPGACRAPRPRHLLSAGERAA